MKKLIPFFLTILCITLYSCSFDEEPTTRTVNIKFDVSTSRNTEAMIDRTIDDDIQSESVENMPYSFTKTQQVIDVGTFLKLAYLESGEYLATSSGETTWTDYSLTLSILIDDEIVETETFEINQSSGVKAIEYIVQ